MNANTPSYQHNYGSNESFRKDPYEPTANSCSEGNSPCCGQQRNRLERVKTGDINEDRKNPGSEGGSFCCGFILSIILLIILMSMSPVSQSFVLSPGETFRIPVTSSVLTQYIQMTNEENMEVNMYHITEKCPPLSGPTSEIDESYNMTLEPGDYEYDFYHLNKGSRIKATLSLDNSGGDLLLFRGKDSLQKFLDESSGDVDPLRQSYASGSGSDAHISYTATRSDTYYIIYDNVLAQTLQGKVQIQIIETSYDISGYSPQCATFQNYQSDCTVNLPLGSSVGCILVAASNDDDEMISATESNQNTGNISGSIRIERHRRWSYIIIISCIPTMISLLQILITKLMYQNHGNNIHSSSHSYSSLVSYSDRPPPNNPFFDDDSVDMEHKMEENYDPIPTAVTIPIVQPLPVPSAPIQSEDIEGGLT